MQQFSLFSQCKMQMLYCNNLWYGTIYHSFKFVHWLKWPEHCNVLFQGWWKNTNILKGLWMEFYSVFHFFLSCYTLKNMALYQIQDYFMHCHKILWFVQNFITCCCHLGHLLLVWLENAVSSKLWNAGHFSTEGKLPS